ncbi:radical SAM protein [uncultured Ilyobacter sp.]|uniref:radical SAM protein n=1 Tax=uncultured Ilyobacter sp. TaxID=544433 RepID=UPI0029F5B7D8|nr:radical SAM protein [uncultured Ilyobacter sp.]
MNISKKEALEWFEFLSEIPSDSKQVFGEYNNIIRSTMRQIEKSYMSEIKKLQESIPELKDLKGRTYYVGEEENFPKGCLSCLFGDGLGGIRKTHTCNLTCKFCYYHDSMDDVEQIPEGMWDIGDNLYEEDDIDLLLSIQKKPSGIAYVYLEPFMEIEEYYSVVKKFNNAGIHQHMYTNGVLCTDENLKKLSESGLDELRFNLGASNCSDKVIEAMKTAKKYFKAVGIETPMTPEFYDSFIGKKEEILSIGLDFINCAEFHIGPDNINNYIGEKFYVYKNGYLSPMWSRKITCKLMKMASEEKWDMLVHDCSNHTKYAREINKASKQGGSFGSHSYFSEFDRPLPYLFLPILKDMDFKFLNETPLPYHLKLENCKEAILESLSEESEEEFCQDFEDYISN